ncbi:hypothetical protein GGX14DRAFT_394569 [Mycena pura]|uniref:Uncharacterized protein n=1 Tax=Mycena pura TaxID=153505 RepID=A0AAD6YBP4_9AGAR|nr:hypothetical protein GGX14DRAFT_394569 [Mycena pura]
MGAERRRGAAQSGSGAGRRKQALCMLMGACTWRRKAVAAAGVETSACVAARGGVEWQLGVSKTNKPVHPCMSAHGAVGRGGPGGQHQPRVLTPSVQAAAALGVKPQHSGSGGSGCGAPACTTGGGARAHIPEKEMLEVLRDAREQFCQAGGSGIGEGKTSENSEMLEEG